MMTRDNSFENFEHFLDGAREAPLLSKCGGPYPVLDGVKPVPWDEARGLAACYFWDCYPGLQLDRLMIGAWQQIMARAEEESKSSAVRRSWWHTIVSFVSSRPSHSPNAKMQLLASISDASWRIADDAETKMEEATGVAEVLGELFQAVAVLIYAGELNDYPLLELAAELALEGYLPVDIERDGEKTTLLIY